MNAGELAPPLVSCVVEEAQNCLLAPLTLPFLPQSVGELTLAAWVQESQVCGCETRRVSLAPSGGNAGELVLVT